MSALLFLAIFNTPMKTLQEFFSTYQSIEQVFNDINDVVKGEIIFSEYDAVDDSIETKYRKFLSSDSEMIIGTGDVEIFFNCIYSFITQATDVLFTSMLYNIVPYVRFNVCHRYVILLASIFANQPDYEDKKGKLIDKMRLMRIAHTLRHCFDVSQIQNVPFSDYVLALDRVDFSNSLIQKVERNFLLPPQSRKHVSEIVNEELASLYSTLNTRG